MSHVLVYVPEGAIRQVQKKCLSSFPLQCSRGRRWPEAREDRHQDSSKPWQLYLLPYHCGLGRDLKLSFKNNYKLRVWLNITTEGEEDELDLCRRHQGVYGESVNLNVQEGASADVLVGSACMSQKDTSLHVDWKNEQQFRPMERVPMTVSNWQCVCECLHQTHLA